MQAFGIMLDCGFQRLKDRTESAAIDNATSTFDLWSHIWSTRYVKGYSSNLVFL